MKEKHLAILKDMLFQKKMSRNRQFERYESSEMKRILRIARRLRFLREQMNCPDVHCWTESMPDGRLCVHLHHPQMSTFRDIMLQPVQWELLHHPDWTLTERKDR